MTERDFQRAANFFLKAEATRLEAPGFHFHLGEAYRRLKDYDRARERFSKMLVVDPGSASAWLGLARVHSSLRENEQGIEAAKTALGLNYHLAPAHYCIGVCQTRTRNFEAAIKSFETAISMNPNFSQAHVRLSRIYRHVFRDTVRANEHYETADRLRNEHQAHKRRNVLSNLPDFATINYDEALPTFPKTSINPRLGDSPREGSSKNEAPVYVVSGLPRSGTSMMMQMLAAGGIEPYTDNQRQADESNPRGYFELEKVKQLPQQNDWLNEAVGKAIKVVSPLIPHLPQQNSYRVVIMKREIGEILDSQKSMLERLGKKGADLTDKQLESFLTDQYRFAIARLDIHAIPYLVVDHAAAIADPVQTAHIVAEFLGVPLNQDAMSGTIDESLHRQKNSTPAQ